MSQRRFTAFNSTGLFHRFVSQVSLMIKPTNERKFEMEDYELDEARKVVSEARKVVEASFIKMSLLKDAFYKSEKDYIKKLEQFKTMDYELALKDGRFKKLPSQGERKEKKQPQLTLDQLKSIAEKLGFDLSSIDRIDDIKEVDNEKEI